MAEKLVDNNIMADENTQIMVKRISFSKLFESISTDFYFDNSNPISILIGPNGCGKTTTFKFLDFILSPSPKKFEAIYNIPFESFTCELSNNVCLSLTKKKMAINEGESQFLTEAVLGENPFDFYFEMSNPEHVGKSIAFSTCFSNVFNMGRHFAPQRNFVFENMKSTLLASVFTDFANGIKMILDTSHCSCRVLFIGANRLQKEYLSTKIVHADKTKNTGDKIDFLTLAEDDAQSRIARCLNVYNQKLSEAKNKLPLLYINAPIDNGEEYLAFKTRWDKYHQELKKFHKIGIIDSDNSVIEEENLEIAYGKKSVFLKTYLDAFECTLGPLQSKYKKLKLFVDIFNKRNEITGKTVKFTQNGIEVFYNNKKIKLEQLSSGEKNDFIMFYRLIFMTPKNGIVLIDEPEISLHIEWQEEYIDRLLTICKMNGLQAIVATHSPNIINGHVELLTEKKVTL